jgi:hypothetical protein
MSRHFEAFDRLRAQGFFVGEMIWNFADFKTAQSKYKQTVYYIIRSIFPTGLNFPYFNIFVFKLSCSNTIVMHM